MKFKVVKKGYDINEVDSYLFNKDRIEKDNMQDKILRIDELKSELAKREVELKELRAKSESVNMALVSAIDKAKDMETSAKLKLTLELERLKLFRAKWQSYGSRAIAECLPKGRLEEITARLLSLETELYNMAAERLHLSKNCNSKASPDVAEACYIEESKRLIDKIKLQYCDKPQEVLSSTAELNLDGINDEHDLAELIASL